MSIKFDYDETSDVLTINENDNVRVYQFHKNKYGDLFRSMIKAIDDLDNQGGGSGDGDVVGPDSSIDGHIAVFDGTTGKIIKDGGSISSGTQSDYNQSDDTAEDYIKNKPFYDVPNDINTTVFSKYGWYIENVSDTELITGNFIPLAEGDTYNISYNETLYENISVIRLDYEEYEQPIIRFMLGNSNEYIRRGGYTEIPPEIRDSQLDSDLPFCIDMIDGSPSIYVWTKPTTESTSELVITDATDESKTYTISLPLSQMDVPDVDYKSIILPGDYNYNINLFNPITGDPQDIIVNDITYHCTWDIYEDEGGFRQYGIYYEENDIEISLVISGSLQDETAQSFAEISILGIGEPTDYISVNIPLRTVAKQIDKKFIPVATEIAKDVSGFTTGHQVFKAVSKVLPELPGFDGVYRLIATINSGEVTYSWRNDS